MKEPETPLEAIQQLAVTLGSQSAVARHLDISRAHVHDLLNGRRSFSEPLAKQLGFRRKIVRIYERISTDRQKPVAKPRAAAL